MKLYRKPYHHVPMYIPPSKTLIVHDKTKHSKETCREITITGDHKLSIEGFSQLSSKHIVVTTNDTAVVSASGVVEVSAEKAINLRCGDACLTISADGAIAIQGKSIVLRGGSTEVILE